MAEDFETPSWGSEIGCKSRQVTNLYALGLEEGRMGHMSVVADTA